MKSHKDWIVDLYIRKTMIPREKPKKENSEKFFGQKISSREKDCYYENGYKVFTENFHLKRGYCCKSNCRHCPYGKQSSKNTS